MANLFEYAEKFGKLKFGELGLTEADNAVFCRLAYYDFSEFTGHTLGEAASQAEISDEDAENKKSTSYLTIKLLKQIGKTERFKNTVIQQSRETVSEDLATAFYAVTFKLDENLFFSAFRGTDEKIVSFYEDAELAYKFPISSQATALRYISETIEKLGGRHFIGGHSKGGNLAIFAFLFLSNQEKDHVIRVYNNDGPGLPNEVAEIMFTPQASETVYNLLPEDSIIGRMLAPGGKTKIIKSDAVGGAQHNMFTWILKGSEFEAAKRFSLLSEYMEDTLTESLETTEPEQLRSIVQKLFEIAKSAGIKTIDDINIKNYKSIIAAVPELYKLANDENGEIPAVIKTLFSSFINSINLEKMMQYSLPDLEDTINSAAQKFAENREKTEAEKQQEKKDTERIKAEKQAEKQREKEEAERIKAEKQAEKDNRRKEKRDKRQTKRSLQREQRSAKRNTRQEKRSEKQTDNQNK